MAAEIVTALIAASGAIVLAGATYWFTKKREREAELRKEKLEHYKDFVASLSGIISGETTNEGQLCPVLQQAKSRCASSGRSCPARVSAGN
jgi:hypothetical protein